MARTDKPDGAAEPLELPDKGRLQAVGEQERATLREQTRSWIAKKLVALLIVVVLALVGLVGDGRIKVNVALSIIAPVTAVVGTALGFYFGGHKSGE